MKRIVQLLLLLVPGFLMAQGSPVSGFSITGTIKGLSENAVETLIDFNNTNHTLARTLVKKGTFNLKGRIAEPNLYQVNFHDVQKKFLFFIGYDTVSLTGDASVMQNMVVKGSRTHADFVEFQQSFNPLVQRLSDLNQRIASKPDIKREDSLMIAYSANFALIKKTIDDFVTNKPQSPVSPFVVLVTSELEQDVSALERRYQQMTQTQQTGFYGKLLKDQIDKDKVGAIGTDAIGFTQNDTLGKPVSLASFRGKYVLVDFWAGWCVPCRAETPMLVNLYDEYSNKGFAIISVSLDGEREAWTKAIIKDKMTWANVSDLNIFDNEVSKLYGIASIPQNILINPDGKIIAKNLRGIALKKKLGELIK